MTFLSAATDFFFSQYIQHGPLFPSVVYFIHCSVTVIEFIFHIFPSYMSKEILTIREAVWLTDNTYKYEDLVRMMGEVVSVLEGKIRVSTSSFHMSYWRLLKS